MADLEKDELQSRGKKAKPKPSLSNYKEPELMPMREKEILSRKDQKAKDLVTNDAKRYGINLDMGDRKGYNYGKVINPPSEKEDDKTSLKSSVNKFTSKDTPTSATGFMELKGKAPQEKVPELDSKQLMDDAKKQRKARWGDALTGFGQVMQGKTVNTDNWETTKLQRKRDAQFQEYKDITANNKKVKEVWDAKNRDELIDFLEKQQKTRDLNEREQAKLAEARFIKDRDFALKAATEEAKFKSGYYNKRTSSGKADQPKFNLPFESENIINEMNNLTGGASEAKTKRNQQRLTEILYDQETGKPVANADEIYNNLVEMSNKSAKLRTQIEKKEKAYNEAIKSDDAVNAPKYQEEIDKLTAELETYQTNIKSILNGKAPAAATAPPKVNKDGYEAFYGKDYEKEMTGEKQAQSKNNTEKSNLSEQQKQAIVDHLNTSLARTDITIDKDGTIAAEGAVWNLNNPDDIADIKNFIKENYDTKLAEQRIEYRKKETANKSKPKQVIQNGITYTLNETTGEYE